MIGSLRARQRGDLLAFADGIQAWLQGKDSFEATAAGVNVAEVLTLVRLHLTGKE